MCDDACVVVKRAVWITPFTHEEDGRTIKPTIVECLTGHVLSHTQGRGISPVMLKYVLVGDAYGEVGGVVSFVIDRML